MRMKIFALLFVMMSPVSLFAQMDMDSLPPLLKSYQDQEGRIYKNHYFNFVVLKDQSGENERQATGKYWEISYVYDSVFRQKELFADFMKNQVNELGGVLFFADTAQIHFAIPRDTLPNIWGKVLLRNDRVYRLQVVEETAFENSVSFDQPITPVYAEFVEPVDLPEKLGFLPNSRITSARFSKFNHYRITYTANGQSYRQILMGPYWDLKLEVIDKAGETDSRISPVQIMESYYRAAIQAKGTIIKSKPRELIYVIPDGEDQKLYVRIMTSLDGLYYIKAVLQSNADETEPISALEFNQQDK